MSHAGTRYPAPIITVLDFVLVKLPNYLLFLSIDILKSGCERFQSHSSPSYSQITISAVGELSLLTTDLLGT